MNVQRPALQVATGAEVRQEAVGVGHPVLGLQVLQVTARAETAASANRRARGGGGGGEHRGQEGKPADTAL